MESALDTAARLLLCRDDVDADACPWWLLGFQHMDGLRAVLLERYSVARAKLMLSGVRRVLHRAWRLKLMSYEQYIDAINVERIVIPKDAALRGRDLKEVELRAIFTTIKDVKQETTRSRDAALFALLLGAGLRRAEVVNLDVRDFDDSDGRVLVRHGKGRKPREVFVRNEAKTYISDWLRVRAVHCPGDGPLLLHVDRHGKLRSGRLSTTAIWKRWRKYAPGSPHDARRTYVGRLLDAGADLPAVQRLLGHASPVTTSRYDRRHARALVRAAELVRLPVVPS
jgi:integrase